MSERLVYARDGNCKIELRGKGKYEDVARIELDSGPERDVGVRGECRVLHVEKRVSRRLPISLADHDKVSPKRNFDGVAAAGRDGRIDACVRLAKIGLCPRRFPSS